MDYEREDRIALERFLLSERVCPRCRSDLLPVALFEDVFGCKKCKETWHCEDEEVKTEEKKDG